jgi:hypothetical protein
MGERRTNSPFQRFSSGPVVLRAYSKWSEGEATGCEAAMQSFVFSGVTGGVF